MGINPILQQVPDMSLEDLQTLRAVLDHWITMKQEPADLVHVADCLRRAWVTVLRSGAPSARSLLTNTSMRRGLEEVARFTERHFSSLSKQQRLAATHVILGLVLTYAKDLAYNRPMVLNDVAIALQRVGAVVDSSFPGYAESGLLARIITKSRPE